MSATALHASHTKPNDIIYTPLPIAEQMIAMCDIAPTEWVLDPSKGAGVFYNHLPPCHKAYCEIEEGKDFFDWTTHVDVIVGNPPFSLWTKWLKHTVTLCDRFCYIFGANNMTPNRLQLIHEAGFGVTKIHTVKVAWWMSQSFIILCEKGKPSCITVTPGTFPCEYCHTMCGRGINGNPPNECHYDKKMEARRTRK